MHATTEDEYLWDNLGESCLDSLSTCHLAGPEGPETRESMHCRVVLSPIKCAHTGKDLVSHHSLVVDCMCHHVGFGWYWLQPIHWISDVSILVALDSS